MVNATDLLDMGLIIIAFAVLLFAMIMLIKTYRKFSDKDFKASAMWFILAGISFLLLMLVTLTEELGDLGVVTIDDYILDFLESMLLIITPLFVSAAAYYYLKIAEQVTF